MNGKPFVMGMLTGALAALAVAAIVAPRWMLRERTSPLSLDDTVAAITNNAVAAGWVVQGVAALDENVRKHGGDPGRPVRVIQLCHAGHAARILQNDGARVASTLMPCRISVYETADGVRIGTMNAGLIGRLFGGVIARVMGGAVAADQEAFVTIPPRQSSLTPEI